ncbi:MAG: tetratricopeptide repeat protein, partial [Methylococcaceae bacterium]
MTNTAQTNSDREIRVFISSTFRDMHAERDYLVSHVFPVIRRACRERQVEFTEIDLRWGVTSEEAEQGKVVRICLEEINRCRPYFLSLLGERYGWAPLDTDLDHKAELLALFPFLENSLKESLSVTEMEILHGVMDNPDMAGHCFFYLRDQTFTHALADQSNHSGDYFEFDTINQDKLNNLKSRILASGFPVCDNYAQLEDLGEKIKQDLLAMLDQRYPQEQLPTPLEAERLAHRNYARDRCQSYIANQSDLDRLNSHLKNKNHTPLIITGESGLGKSALLAYWLCQKQVQNTECFFIEHYIGIAGDADPVSVLRRIIAEIKYRTGDAEDMPGQPDDVVRDFPLWLARVRANDPLLLILDGLNQLEQEQLNWLPSFWPDTVSAYISVILGEQLQTLTERDYTVFTLQGLETDRRQQLIETWLATYRKALSREQVSQLINAPQTQNPLFLRTVLEELRIFGYFEQLDNRINSLLSAQNPAELFALVLERLETDFGKNIVSQIMRALWAARRGLSETEIAGITGLSRLVISTFLMAIDAHLAKRGGLLNFFHDYLRQAVKLHSLESKETETHAHIKLAQYFELQELNDRVAEELPWQWQQAEHWEALKDCISAIPMFDWLYRSNKYQLLAYWLYLDDFDEPGECYLNSFKKWMLVTVDTEEDIAAILNCMGCFLFIEYTSYATAEQFLLQSLALFEKTLGPNNIMTNGSWYHLAMLREAQGNYAEAELIFRKVLAIDEIELISVGQEDTILHLCGLANILSRVDKATEAETLFRRAIKLGNDGSAVNGLANLLSHQGNYVEAELLHRRVLLNRKALLGFKHPDTIMSQYNLAIVLVEQGNYVEAEQLYRSALVSLEETFGQQHPETARVLSNLANLLKNYPEKSLEAELIYRRALNIRENILGSEHPDTALSLHNLASLLNSQGKSIESESLYRRAMTIQEAIFGDNHSTFLQSIKQLGMLLHDRGNYNEAEPLYRRLLLIYERVLGAEHPDTIAAVYKLARLLNEQGNDVEASSLYHRALVAYEESLEDEQTKISGIYYNLALIRHDLGDLVEAESLYQQAIAVFKSGHPDTVKSLHNLANLYFSQCKYESAELLYRKALSVIRQSCDSSDKVKNLTEVNLKQLLNGPLSNRELLWKQPDFITATGYAKSIAELSDQSSLTCSSLLLGARTANLAGRLEKPIEALTKHASLIEEAENNMGLTSGQIVIPILDRPVPMDEKLKALLQDYRQSTLECLI